MGSIAFAADDEPKSLEDAMKGLDDIMNNLPKDLEDLKEEGAAMQTEIEKRNAYMAGLTDDTDLV